MMMMMILARLPIADSINPGGDISNSPSRLRHYTRPPSPTSDKRLFIWMRHDHPLMCPSPSSLSPLSSSSSSSKSSSSALFMNETRSSPKCTLIFTPNLTTPVLWSDPKNNFWNYEILGPELSENSQSLELSLESTWYFLARPDAVIFLFSSWSTRLEERISRPRLEKWGFHSNCSMKEDYWPYQSSHKSKISLCRESSRKSS